MSMRIKAMIQKLANILKGWLHKDDGVTAIEASMLFPVLIALLAAVVDLGSAIVSHQKTITASQIVGDLVSRKPQVTQDEVLDYINAAALAYDSAINKNGTFGVDIASVRFDSEGDPVVVWRETVDMDPYEPGITDSKGLGTSGDGVVVVTVTYTFRPLFSKYISGDIEMIEVSYLHGRRTPIIECPDCTV